MLNIGGGRTRTFLKLTNRWRSDICVLFRGVFRVEECIELIWHLKEKIGVNVGLNLRYKACINTRQVRFGRYVCCFPLGVFPTTRVYIYTANSIAPAEKHFIEYFIRIINQNKKTIGHPHIVPVFGLKWPEPPGFVYFVWLSTVFGDF